MSLLACCLDGVANREFVCSTLLAVPEILRNKYGRVAGTALAVGFITMVAMDGFQGKAELAAESTNQFAPLLGGVSTTRAMEHWNVQQNLIGPNGMSWSVSDASNPANSTLFQTKGELFSAHKSGHTYGTDAREPLAYFRNTLWSLREIWEIATYNNTCGAASPESGKNGKVSLYPFARMTKSFWTLYPHFTMERYDCDGSLKEQWTIAPKYWISILNHWYVRESKTGQLVGMIDEKVTVLRRTYDTKMTAGEDKALFVHAVILADRSCQIRSGSSGSSGGGGNSNLRGGGGGVSAR